MKRFHYKSQQKKINNSLSVDIFYLIPFAISSVSLYTTMNTIITVLLFLIPVFLLLTKRKRSPQRVPPGSLGLPLIGQSLGLLRAMRSNTAEEWLRKRIRKYGPISKMRLFGKPAVFIYGQAANKFVFASDSSNIVNQQVKSVSSILGDRCILELTGEDHKRVRDALVSFLKPGKIRYDVFFFLF